MTDRARGRARAAIGLALLSIALIGSMAFGYGTLLLAQDRRALDARDRRLMRVICAHVIAEEAYTAAVRAYRLQRRTTSPADLTLLAAIDRKEKADHGLDREACQT